ncbi:MAG: hypothetical protein P4L03_00475 [Terracidiphilus sp.]|nr:hypothetical protein [Terracidiphilus sp.]
MSDNVPHFRLLDFGYSDAEIEASRNPSLLTDGFLNLNEVIDELRSGERFLVLGNKGTGKTAIAEHLKFSANATTFVTIANLATFPYNDLKHIVEDDNAEPGFPTAWSWLLLVNILSSFAADNGGNIHSHPELSRIFSALDRVGLLPAAGSLKELLVLSRKRSFRVDLPFGIQLCGDEQSQPDLHLPFFVEKVQSALLKFESKSSHLLVIDGLDEVLNLAQSHLEPISGLVSESFRINSAFQKNGISAKVILLCRTDLFDRLPGSNTNKVRQDCAIQLNWYTPNLNSSPLWSLANLRATLQIGPDTDILATYFPRRVERADPRMPRVLPSKPSETSQYLLRHTRFTPRDFVALLRSIQGQTRGISIRQEDIGAALQEYAVEYFLPEIRNELSGYCTSEEISALVDAFALIRDSRFSLEKLEEIVPESIRTGLPKLLRVLFDCSAIGNWEEGDRSTGTRTYRYKNRNMRLNLHAPMSLHPALGLAFNTLAPSKDDSPSDDSGTSHGPGELIGTVEYATSSWGFIRGDGEDSFHYKRSNVIDGFAITLNVGDRVSFVKETRKDPKFMHYSALNVQRIEKYRQN